MPMPRIRRRHPVSSSLRLWGKRVENRPQHRAWRSWVLLRSGQQTDTPALRLLLVARTIRGRQLVTGAMVGVARITGCHQDPDGAPRSTVGWRRTNVAPTNPASPHRSLSTHDASAGCLSL